MMNYKDNLYISMTDAARLRGKLATIANHEIIQYIISQLSTDQTQSLQLSAIVNAYVDKVIDAFNNDDNTEQMAIATLTSKTPILDHMTITKAVNPFYEKIKGGIKRLINNQVVIAIFENDTRKYYLKNKKIAASFLETLKETTDKKLEKITNSKANNGDELKEEILAVIQTNPGISQKEIPGKLSTSLSNVNCRKRILELVNTRFIERVPECGIGTGHGHSYTCFLSNEYIDHLLKNKLITEDTHASFISKHVLPFITADRNKGYEPTNLDNRLPNETALNSQQEIMKDQSIGFENPVMINENGNVPINQFNSLPAEPPAQLFIPDATIIKDKQVNSNNNNNVVNFPPSQRATPVKVITDLSWLDQFDLTKEVASFIEEQKELLDYLANRPGVIKVELAKALKHSISGGHLYKILNKLEAYGAIRHEQAPYCQDIKQVSTASTNLLKEAKSLSKSKLYLDKVFFIFQIKKEENIASLQTFMVKHHIAESDLKEYVTAQQRRLKKNKGVNFSGLKRKRLFEKTDATGIPDEIKKQKKEEPNVTAALQQYQIFTRARTKKINQAESLINQEQLVDSADITGGKFRPLCLS